MGLADKIQDVERKIRRRKLRKPGTVEDALALQWEALETARTLLHVHREIGNPAGMLSAVHAITQGTAAYAKLVDATDFAARLEALEAAEAARSNPNMRKVA